MDWFYSFLTFFLILSIVLISLTTISPKCQYWVKLIVMFLYFFVSSATVIPFGLVTRNPAKTGNFWAALNRLVSYLLGLRWKTIGQENVDKNQTYVVVVNHQTILDTLAASHCYESFDRITMIVKKELLYVPILGLTGYLTGGIFLNRGKSDASRNAINEAGKRAKESGISLMLFPEGTRNSAGGGSLLPFKKGAFHVALDIGVPILPMVVSEYDFLGPDGARTEKFTSGNVTIKILPPIQTEGVRKDQIDDLIKETRDSMIEALKTMKSN